MSEIPAGAMRFNSDSQKLEYWNGSAWFQVHTATPNLASAGDPTPGARGIIGGGGFNVPTTSYRDSIEYVNISSAGDSIDFGDLNVARLYLGATASSTRAVFNGGQVPSGTEKTMEFVTIASTGNATDFGDRTISDFYNGAASSPTRAVFSGDYQVVTMDAVEIMTTGNAFDFGDLTQGRLQNVGTSNGHGGL